jgi:alpha-tubulin suppressor-like RCC1 family protein
MNRDGVREEKASASIRRLAIAATLCALGSAAAAAQTPWDSLRFVAVSAGGKHTCAITRTATAYCWGENDFGEVGASPSTRVETPVMVRTPALTATAAGTHHSCGLDRDGVVWCWGSNKYGQLGNRRTKSSATPIAVSFDVRFSAITAGGNHTCALGVDQLAYCWGDQWDRAVGSFDAGDNVREPMPVRGAHRFLTLSAGARHTCGVDSDHHVLCWGENSNGQLGVARSRQRVYAPTVAQGMSSAAMVSASAQFTCALGQRGELACWGNAAPNTANAAQTPLRILSAGQSQLCGVALDGQLRCWGSGAAPSGAAVGAYTQIASGDGHSCAIDVNQRLICWGDDSVGQLGPSGAAVNGGRP